MCYLLRPSILLVLISLLCHSCLEKEDVTRPEITILEPLPNLIIFMPDTIKFTANISDDEVVSFVMVVLTDPDGNPMIPASYRYPGTPHYSLSAFLKIDDKTLKSGSYRIKVTASDGNNSTTSYLPVIINEIPREFQGCLALTSALPFETTVTRLNNELIEDTTVVIPKGYLLSEINDLWEEFYFASQEPSVLYSYSIKYFDPMWEFSAGLPRPVFTSLFSDRQLLFTTQNGDAGILNASGQVLLRTAPQPDKYIQCFTANDQYLFAEMVSLSGNTREITAFYRSTGGILSQKILNDDVVSLQTSREKALMISNTGIFTVISEFDPENIEITSLLSFHQRNIYSSLKLTEDEFLIFTEDQVMLFDLAQNDLFVYLPQSYRFGRYDDMNGRLFLVLDDQVDIFNAASAEIIHSLSFDKQVRNFHLIYNR